MSAEFASPPTSVTNRKGVWGWMFFDWAAQPFFTVVITFIFGPYFVSRLTQDPISAQTMWSNIATISSIIIAIASPILGSIADQSGPRKPWIAVFAFFKITCLLFLWNAAPSSPIIWPALLIIIASIAAEVSIVFNDSMITRISTPNNVGKISNTAWGLGYMGGIIVLVIVVLFLAADINTGKTLIGLDPLFGLDPKTGEDARITGPITAIWYLIFIIPMFLFTPDISHGKPIKEAIKTGFLELKTTYNELKHRRSLLRFLISRMLYQDGVNGVLILGGVFAAGMFGWATMEIGLFGILLNIVAIFSCLVAGYIDQYIGSKKTIMMSLILLIIATIGIVSTTPHSTLFELISLSTIDDGSIFATGAERAYLVFGVLIGIAFGPIQASSRSYLARNIKKEEAGRYFGIYALTGRATSFLATLSFSALTYLSGSAHVGMASLVALLTVGALLLIKVPDKISDP